MVRQIITLLSSVLVLSGCMSTSTYYPKPDQASVSKERQNQIDYVQNNAGQKAIQQGNYKERLSKVANDILRGGMSLCYDLGKPESECRFSFGLATGAAVNAYADGRTIYVSQPMMDLANTNEELAVVMGHEYAHNLMKHVKAKQTNAMVGGVVGALMDTFAASQGMQTQSSLSKMGSNIGAMSYSKDFEKEADYIGLYVTQRAGYDISNAPELWRKMSLQDSKAIYNGVTHPSNPERYVALGQTIREIDRKKEAGEPLVPNIKHE